MLVHRQDKQQGCRKYISWPVRGFRAGRCNQLVLGVLVYSWVNVGATCTLLGTGESPLRHNLSLQTWLCNRLGGFLERDLTVVVHFHGDVIAVNEFAGEQFIG